MMAQLDSKVPSAEVATSTLARLTQLDWSWVPQAIGAALWIGLVSWKLTTVPGMVMDEAWAIISARGQWPPANPMSGVSSYVAPFPILLLDLFGTRSGLLVLRAASVAANGAAVLLIGRMLRRLYPARRLAWWALPLIATSPAWLVMTRTGIEITMFTPLLAVLALHLSMGRTGWWAFAAGTCWGLLIYNHMIGLFAVLGIGSGWLAVYRKLPLPWRPALAGLGLGLLPRVIGIVFFDTEQIAGVVDEHSLARAFADLVWMPGALWDTLLGRTVYLRRVGRIAEDVLPYWSIAVLPLAPWLLRLRAVPRPAWFMLSSLVFFCVLTTLGSPYLASRYLLLAAIGVPVVVVMFGAATSRVSKSWGRVVRASAGAVVLGNLYYMFHNFYVPWDARDLGVTTYRLGTRSPPFGSWHFLPKDGLARALRRLDPRPEQIVSTHSLNRPLWAMLNDTGIRTSAWEDADIKLRSVFLDYGGGKPAPRRCVEARLGTMCFHRPSIVDTYFVLYHGE